MGRKVARLPDRGTLLFATDMQGNLDDYEAMKSLYFEEKAAGNEPTLLFCGDLVHGPGTRLAEPSSWPTYLGTYYRDQSPELIFDLMALCKKERVFSLLGNHEHAHVGGPVVSKFHDDEAAALEARLGEPEATRVRAFMEQMPLLAVAPCGAVFVHGAPRATEPDLDAFEELDYGGFQECDVSSMIEAGTLGSLLWARAADTEQARELLTATSLDGEPNAFVAYGHDVVREGFEKIGDEQLCLSTSFGCDDANKYYLRLDLSRRYRCVGDLRLRHELRPLYPHPK